MTSDVVRWSQLYTQQNQQRDIMTSDEKMRPTTHQNAEMDATEYKHSRNTRRSLIARTIGTHLHKTVLLFFWLVINQNVSLVLSDPILATSNLTIAAKNIAGDELIHSPIDDVVMAASSQESSNDIDLPSQYHSHQIIGDDDISNDRDFTATWAVHIPGGDNVAEHVAREHGFTNLGKVS